MMTATNPIVDALAKEEAKLVRQQENHAATQAVIDILGESAKELNKLERQKKAMAETQANIKKLSAALK